MILWAYLTLLSASLVSCKETLEDAARNVRSLIAAQSIGTLASVYPDTASSQLYDHPYTPRSAIKEGEDGFYTASSPNALPPPYLAGHAFALPEYYAPCFPNNGSLLLIMFRISQNARNILASTSTTPKNSLSNAYDEQVPIMSEERETAVEKIEWKMSGRATFVVQELPLSHSPVSRPRVSLVGNVTLLSDSWSTPSSSSSYPLPSAQENAEEEEALLDELASCYVKYHPDAKWWVPGKGVFHDVAWGRFDPEAVYYVGGFGGEHYIGYIPLDLYQQSG